MALNVSIFALPIYWLLVIMTRAYSVLHLRRHGPPAGSQSSGTEGGAEPPLFDNASPHSSAVAARLAKTLTPEALATYERIQGAHRNGMENMALFFGAVTLGNVARLNALELSLCAWLYVLTRAVYVLLYVRISSNRASFARSATFGLGVFLCWWLLLRAAVYILYTYEAEH